MDTLKQPGIDLKTILIIELNFRRAPIVPEKIDYDINIESVAALNEKKDTLNQTLKVIVKAKDGVSSEASCIIQGQFTTIPDQKNMELEEFSSASAPAVLYPFCREAIASISMKAGMPVILLPPFNFHALAANAKNGKKEEKLV